MKHRRTIGLILQCAFAVTAAAQHEHASHPAPEVLGAVIFPTTCAAAVQSRFERALALLHSFAYTDAEQSFRDVATADPECAIAHWGVAMSMFHQLWDNPNQKTLAEGANELAKARALDNGSPRERAFEDRQTQMRDSYNYAVERVAGLMFEQGQRAGRAHPPDRSPSRRGRPCRRPARPRAPS